MQLAKAQDVVTRMGGSVSQGNTIVAAGSALDAATPFVESIIGTPLAVVTRTDWFSYKPSVYSDSSEVVLYLTQGYVSDAGVTVYLSDSTSSVLQDFSNATALDDEYVILNEEDGTVALQYLPYIGTNTVAVRYEAGFSSRSSSIPEWMRQAAITACVRVLHSQKLGHKKDDTLTAAPELHRALYAQCIEYARPRAFGLAPSRSKVI